jgi:hypothetical protein
MKLFKLQNKWTKDVFIALLAVFVATPASALGIRLDSFTRLGPGEKQYDYSVDLGFLDIVTVEVGGRIILSDMRGVTGQNVLPPATTADRGQWQNNGFTATTAEWIAGVEATQFTDWGTYRVLANTDPGQIQWTITPFGSGALAGLVKGPKVQQIPPPPPASNGTKGAPRMGSSPNAPRTGSSPSEISFDAGTGILSFTDKLRRI